MLLARGDGQGYTGGPLDVICILHNVRTNTFHAAFFEEHPMPGPVPDVKDTPIIRLMSRLTHTAGAPTLEEAQRHLDEMGTKIELPPENVARDKPYPWDGEQGVVWIAPNWRQDPVKPFAEAFPPPK